MTNKGHSGILYGQYTGASRHQLTVQGNAQGDRQKMQMVLYTKSRKKTYTEALLSLSQSLIYHSVGSLSKATLNLQCMKTLKHHPLCRFTCFDMITCTITAPNYSYLNASTRRTEGRIKNCELCCGTPALAHIFYFYRHVYVCCAEWR